MTTPNGWYWHLEDGEDPEIVKVIDGYAYCSGDELQNELPDAPPNDDCFYRLRGRLVGPITPPER